MFALVVVAAFVILASVIVADRNRLSARFGSHRLRRSESRAFTADSSADLPCPWCHAATAEADTRCPSCGQRFG